MVSSSTALSSDCLFVIRWLVDLRHWVYRHDRSLQYNKSMKQPTVATLFEAHSFPHTSSISYTQPVSMPYHQLHPHSPQLSALLQIFQACPFLPLRLLVTSFVVAPPPYHDLISDILQQQYDLYPAARSVDEQYGRVLSDMRYEKLKMGNVVQVLHWWLAMNQPAGQQQASQLHNNRRLRSDMEEWLQAEKTLVQGKTFEQIVADFDTYFRQVKDINAQGKELQNDYQLFKEYQKWLERAASEIVKRDNYPKNEVRTVQQMKQRFEQTLTALTENITKLQLDRFDLRNKVKFGNVAKQDFKRIDMSAVALYRSAYGMLWHMTSALYTSRNELVNLHQRFWEAYKRFLKQYRVFEHISQLIKLQPEYCQIVKQQQNRLTSHLKKHHALMVPYQPSQPFTSVLDNLKDTSYQPQNYKRQLHDFQQALTFLNTTYPRLFKKVCESKGNREVAFEIENNVKQLNEGLKEGYNVILMEALGRLQYLNSDDRRI